MTLAPAHRDLVELLAQQAARAWLRQIASCDAAQRGTADHHRDAESGAGEGCDPAPAPDMSTPC